MATNPTRARRSLAEFLHNEAAGGIVLVIATVVALLWANVAPGVYEDVWAARAGWEGALHLRLDLHAWVNDALMALFFFVVGLEIKRELVVGELASRKAAATPVIAALGGMVVPAAIYAAMNRNGLAADGWAIPMATDIAFVIGILSLLGSRVPSGLRLFLLAIAIVDDLGAIIVIALFYSSGLELPWLAAAAAVLVGVALMRKFQVRTPGLYIVPAVMLWAFVHESGLHATIAGVAMGLMTPARPIEGRAIIDELEHLLHPLSAFVVVPVFALANAGVKLSGDSISGALSSSVAWGVIAGLLVGKSFGITGAALIAHKTRLGQLPDGVGMRHLIGGAVLAAIGFTVALFIADLSFAGTELIGEVKIAILFTSIVAAVAGSAVLLRARPRPSAHLQRAR